MGPDDVVIKCNPSFCGYADKIMMDTHLQCRKVSVTVPNDAPLDIVIDVLPPTKEQLADQILAASKHIKHIVSSIKNGDSDAACRRAEEVERILVV